MTADAHRVRRALSSAESAALAGVAAALLFTVSVWLLARQPGVGGPSTDLRWYTDPGNQTSVVLALNLNAFGVVAFLWFMAVVRRRLGDREDRFFATVFLGSGLAFAVLTISAAVAAAVPTVVAWAGDGAAPDHNTVAVAHAAWFGLWQVSASRLVGVFMISTSTVGRRFGAFPRWLSAFGLLAGAFLSVTGAFVGPLDVLFPLWLLVVSLTLLFTGLARRQVDD